MSKDGSYREILRSTFILGGASIINIASGLVRMKVAAALLGPAGVGLIGLLSNLISITSTIVGLGFGNVGTREIAAAVGRNDDVSVAVIRRALFLGTLFLALIGAGVFWALREVLAIRVIGDVSLAGDVGWMALVVALTVGAGSQTALLNGMRKVDDIARVSVLAGLFSSVFGCGALVVWGANGLLIFLIVGPLAGFLIGMLFTTRLPKADVTGLSMNAVLGQWRIFITMGVAFVVAGLASTIAQLLVRAIVQRQLGANSLGYFQAAATISITYIGVILTSMGTDYYPRLTAVIHDHAVVKRMVNEQTEVAFILAAPIFFIMMALAPWIINLLYSSNFLAAAEILRWQILGDILKVASWPLGFVLLAGGYGHIFMFTEILASIIFVVLTWIGIPFFGVAATGLGFLGIHIVNLPLIYWIVRSKTDFRWSSKNFWNIFYLFFCGAGLLLLSIWFPILSTILGLFFALNSLVKVYFYLSKKIQLNYYIRKFFKIFCNR